MFRYNKEERRTECRCDTAAGFVFWNETGKCYRVYTQGPCPDNAWLIPTGDLSEVYCECRNGFYFAAKDYLCKRSSQVLLPRNLPALRTHRFDVKDSNKTRSIVKQRQRIGRTVHSETDTRGEPQSVED